MFADAIERVSKFTRPVKFITRNFGSPDIIPGTATLFFVNENGVAVTCKHVADEFYKCMQINKKYEEYKAELNSLPSNAKPSAGKAIKNKYGYTSLSTAQHKFSFLDCVTAENNSISFTATTHPKYDLAIISFNNVKTIRYSEYAVFIKDSAVLRQGDFLCRYGFPFAEFTDFKYDAEHDDILWVKDGRNSTPAFPIEGMFTRHVADSEGKIYEYELSTPGLRGQSGGPLFDTKGIVYGMQSNTAHLHLGFDQDATRVRIKGQLTEVENHPFLHVGRCISADVIKAFLNEKGIKYYVGSREGHIEAVNGTAANTAVSI